MKNSFIKTGYKNIKLYINFYFFVVLVFFTVTNPFLYAGGEIILDSNSRYTLFEGNWIDSNFTGNDGNFIKIISKNEKGIIKIKTTNIKPGKYLLYYSLINNLGKWSSENFSLNLINGDRNIKYPIDLTGYSKELVEENDNEYFCGIYEKNSADDYFYLESHGSDNKLVLFDKIIFRDFYQITKYNNKTLRGINTWINNITENDIKYLLNYMHLNSIRFKINYEYVSALLKNKDYSWKKLLELVEYCNKNNCSVLLTIDSIDGRILINENRLFYEKNYQKNIIFLWEKLAANVQEKKINIIYDLLNSPNPDNKEDWYDFSKQIVKAIRTYDKENYILVEFPGINDVFLSILPDQNIIYGLNFYYPEEFSRQRIKSGDKKIVNYPSIINNRQINEIVITQKFYKIINFLMENQKPFFITEFSCIRWAPNVDAYKYLNDLLDIFETLGFSWFYNDYVKEGNYNGFSLFHGNNKMDNSILKTESDRLKLIKNYFSNNRDL